MIVAVAEQERFSRSKHAYGERPVDAAAFCLARAGVSLEAVDVVTFGWDIPRLHHDRGVRWSYSESEALEQLLPRDLLPRRQDPQFRFVDHHLSHAASAFYLSGDSEAAVLVMDGQGEDASATIFSGLPSGLRALEKVPVGWSLGYFYDTVGRFIGLGPDQAGKLMGLAAYGEPLDDTVGAFSWNDGAYELAGIEADIRSRSQIDEDDDVSRHWLAQLTAWSPLPPNPRTGAFNLATGRLQTNTVRDPFDYRDLAATAQHVVEKAALGLARRALEQHGGTTLHLAGGVALNASMNGMLIQESGATSLFVQPLAGDAGVAIGSALVVAAEVGDRIEAMSSSIAWGWEIEPDRTRTVLIAQGARFTEPDDLAASVADLVADDKVVGWAQGRGEVGPRALGQRSIVARPASRLMRDRINLDIKRREWWRPLAPSMTEEAFHDVIDSPSLLPYMIVTRPLQDSVRAELEAVDHVDGSTRPQSVSRDSLPLYHRLLEQVGERTGRAVVLNTSFNDKEEPVVWTAEDAMRTFDRIGLDAVALGPFLVTRS